MGYAVYLKVDQTSYDQFIAIQTALNAGTTKKMAHELGDVLASVSIQVIQQVFIDLLEQQKQRLTRPEGYKVAEDSEKVIEHVLSAFKKYLPWAIAFFGNERLLPMVNYFATCIVKEEDNIFVRYDVDQTTVQTALDAIERVLAGDKPSIPQAFSQLTKMIDTGVDVLIRKPKAMLKFNFVVDKTLNGVIQVSTNMAYKRLEGLGREVQLESAPHYIDHFLKFLKKMNS